MPARFLAEDGDLDVLPLPLPLRPLDLLPFPLPFPKLTCLEGPREVDLDGARELADF